MALTFEQYVKNKDQEEKNSGKLTFNQYVNQPAQAAPVTNMADLLPAPEQKTRNDNHDVLHSIAPATTANEIKEASINKAKSDANTIGMINDVIWGDVRNIPSRVGAWSNARKALKSGEIPMDYSGANFNPATDLYVKQRNERLEQERAGKQNEIKAQIEEVEKQIRQSKATAAQYQARTGGLANSAGRADAQRMVDEANRKTEELQQQRQNLMNELHSIGGKYGIGDFIGDTGEMVFSNAGLQAPDLVDYYLSRGVGLIDENDQAAYDRAHALQYDRAQQIADAQSGRSQFGQDYMQAAAAFGDMLSNTAMAYASGIPQALQTYGSAPATALQNSGIHDLDPSIAGRVVSGADKLTGNILADAIAAPTNVAISLSSGVHTFDEAKTKGASTGQAFAAALGSAAAEYFSNKMFSGTPLENNPGEKGYVVEAIESFSKWLGKEEQVQKFFSNKLASFIFDKTGEGWEEVITAVLEPWIAHATYDKDADLATLKELWNEWYIGTFMSVIADTMEPVTNFRAQKAEAREKENAQRQQEAMARYLAYAAGNANADFHETVSNNYDLMKNVKPADIANAYNVGRNYNRETLQKQSNLETLTAGTMGAEGLKLAAEKRGTMADTDAIAYYNEARQAYDMGRNGEENTFKGEILSTKEANAWYNAGINDAKEDTNEQRQSGNESQGRVNGLDSQGQGGRLAEGAGGQLAGEAAEGQRDGGSPVQANDGGRVSRKEAAVKLSQGQVLTSAAENGISNGTEAKTMHVISEDTMGQWHPEMVEVYNKGKQNGITVKYYTGRMALDDGHGVFFVRGLNVGDGSVVWIRADADEDIRKIADHEFFHTAEKRDPGLKQRILDKITENKQAKTLQALTQKYADKYDGSGLSDEEILSEICADSYGGIDIFAGITDAKDATEEQKARATDLSETVRGAVKESKPVGAKQTNKTSSEAEERLNKASRDVESVTDEEVLYLLNRIAAGDFYNDTYIPLRKDTPPILIGEANGFIEEHPELEFKAPRVENHPIISEVGHLRRTMESEEGGYNPNERPHNLEPEEIIEILHRMDAPTYIVYQTGNQRFTEIVKYYDGKRGKSVIASMDFEQSKAGQYLNGDYKGGIFNTVVTTYSPDNLQKYLDRDDNILVYDKTKDAPRSGSARIKWASHSSETSFNNSIDEGNKKVNTENDKASREAGMSAEDQKTLEKFGATVRNEVVVADSVAKFMDSPEYHQPVSVSDLADMASHDTLPSWAEKYINGGGSKEALNAIQQFDDMIWKSMSGDFTDAQKLLQALVPSGHVDTDKFGPLRTNVEYRRSFDMDTSCPRTFQFVAYRNAIMKRLNRTLTLDESINLINLMAAYHQMIPCTYCYVENKRILKAAYYNNFYAFHNAVLNGVKDGLTVEDLRPKMYGWNAEKGKLTDAAEKTLTQVWMKDTSGYNPTIAQNYHTVNVIRNAAMHLLDDMMEAGKITSDTSVNSLTNIIATEYDIKSRGALAEVTKMAEDWRYDAGRNAEHMYLIEDNGERVNKKTADRALELDNEAIMYANSASSAKTVDNYAPYGGELENISQEDREYILGMGGIRKHSSNDFRIDYVLDYFQFFADLAKGKWTGHTYTKNADYVRIFGRTGDMINMSIAFNDTKDGVTENVSEGMEHMLARELRKAYANAGIMAMVTSDKQLSYALNTDWVDMIIPFHNSGLPKAIWYNMKAWTDYTSVQGEALYNSDDKKAALQSRGIDIKNMSTEEVNDAFYETFGIKKAINTETGKVFAPHFFPYETTQHGVKIPGHNNSKARYMELCKEYGVHPRFDGTIVQNADGNDINVVDHPNYMKLIKETSRATENFQQPTIDFSFADADPYLTEKYGKQYGKKSVTPMDYAMARLYEEAKNGGYQNAADDQFGIVDEFVKKYAGKNKPVGWLDERSKLVKNELDTVQDKLVDKTRKATLKELEKTEGKKKKSKVRSNFYMENSSGESAGVNRGNKNAYSLEDVPAVTPTGGWERGATFDEVKAKHPTLFELAADEAEVRNPTQITGTVKTYRKIYDILKAEGFKGKILDASSGLGVGTEAGRSEYGFDVDDIEPFPDAKYQPKYTDYSKLNKKYDAIISNAVLNVIPQDLRDAMAVKIGQLLAPGGRAYINVRGTDVKNASSKVAINEDGMEYFISDSGSYQKGFRKQELVSYLQDALGDGFTVEPTNQFGGVAAIVTKDGGQNMASRDTDYMDAVESGDMETAQRMVDEAAKAAGYTVKAYHGTPSGGFTEFDPSLRNHGKRLGYGIYFTSERSAAERFTGRMADFNKEGTPTVYNAYLNPGKNVLTIDRDALAEEYGKKKVSLIQYLIDEEIKKHGDAASMIEVKGIKDGSDIKSTVYIVKDSSQVKSADPVTYDDNGNIIPLSERFNSENEDIRYSRDVIGEAPDRNYNIPEGYGVFIRNTRAKYVDKIFSGEKTIETRPNRTLDSYLHKWAPIVDTAKRQVIGEAYIDSVIEYDDAKDFRADADRHLVPENSKYDWDGKGKRYGYVITETRKYDTPIQVPADAKKYGRIATAYSREDDTNRLMQENTDLRQRLDAALADTKQTTAWRANAKDVASVADDIIEATSSKESKAIVAQKIRSLVEAASNGGIDSTEMKDLALDIARGLLKRSSVLTTKDSTTYDGMRDYLKSVYINVPSEMRKEITDWKAFAAAHKAMRMKTTGVAINEAYKEMQKRMGKDYFPDIDSDIDKLRQIAEVLDTLTPVYDNPYSVNMAEATEETANSILESILNIGQAAPTYADRAKARENEVRELYQQKLADQKAYLQQRIQDEADKRKQQTEAVKQHYTEMQENRRLRKQDSEARQKLLRVAKRLQNRKLDAVNRAMVDQLIGDLDTVSVNLTNRSLTNLKELADWYDSYKDDPNFLTDPQVEKKLSRLEKRHIGEMTLDEVRDLTDVLRSIENALATYGKMVRIEDHRLISEMSEQSQENIRNTKGSKKNIADWLVTNTLAPERLLRRLTGYNDSDPLYMRVKELSKGQRKMMDYQMRAEALFSKWTNDKKLIERLRDKDTIKVRAFVDGKETTVEITPDMRMALYLHSLNDQNLKHIMNGGIRIPDIETYRKGDIQDAYDRGVTAKMSPDMVRGIANGMSAEERAFANAAKAYFNGMSRDEINAVSEALLGYALANVENYFPIQTDDAFTQKEIDAIQNDGSIQGMGFTKERKDASNAIYLVPMTDVLKRSIQNHAKYVGMAIPVANMNRLWMANTKDEKTDTTKGLKDAMRSKWGGRANDAVEKILTDVQNPVRKTDDVSKALAKVRSNYAGAVLTLNASVAMKQAASYPTAAAVLGWEPLLKAMKNYGKVDLDLIAKYTPLQWYRSQGFSTQELGDIKSQSGLMDKVLSAHITTKDGREVPLLNWIQGIDLLTTRKLWKASEYYVQQNQKNLRVGSDEYYKAVADIYNRVIEETQPNYTTMQRPQLLRSDNQLLQSLVMFKTQPFQNFNILYDAIGELRAAETMAKNGDPSKLKQARQNAVNAVTSNLVSAVVFAAMTMAWALARRKREKYEDDEGNFSPWGQLGNDILSSELGMIPFGSDAYNLIASAFLGEKYYGMTNITSDSLSGMAESTLNAFNTLKDTVTALLDGDDKTQADPEKIARKLFATAKDASKMLGLPMENVLNLMTAVYSNVASAVNGEYTTAYEILRLEKGFSASSSKSTAYDILYKAYQNDRSQYNELRRMMVDDGFKESSIDSAMKKREKENK